MDGGEGGGNLADELADAWDDEEGDRTGEDLGSSFLEGLREGSVEPSMLHGDDDDDDDDENSQNGLRGGLKSGQPRNKDEPSQGTGLTDPEKSPREVAGNVRLKEASSHQRSGPQGHLPAEEEGFSAGLQRQMAQIEALATKGLNAADSGSGDDGVIHRTTQGLTDLGAQSSIEIGVNRIITASRSVTNYRTQKAREILSLTQSLLMERWPIISEEDIDILIGEVDLLIRHLELGVQVSPLASLQLLISNTADLARSLGSVSDILQESRPASAVAWRRLKNTGDLVTEIQDEAEARERAVRYLENGDWDRRLRDREAERICGDVVAGFETSCDGWRNRLFGPAAATLSTSTAATPV